jgi:hypothetical protein
MICYVYNTEVCCKFQKTVGLSQPQTERIIRLFCFSVFLYLYFCCICNRDADELHKMHLEMADFLSQLSASKQEVKVCK